MGRFGIRWLALAAALVSASLGVGLMVVRNIADEINDAWHETCATPPQEKLPSTAGRYCAGLAQSRSAGGPGAVARASGLLSEPLESFGRSHGRARFQLGDGAVCRGLFARAPGSTRRRPRPARCLERGHG